jgi:hypothetical protein
MNCSIYLYWCPQYLQLEVKDFDQLCRNKVYFISSELSKNSDVGYNFCSYW